MTDSEAEQPSRKRVYWQRALTFYCYFAAFGSLLSLGNGGAIWPINLFDALLHGLLWPAPIFLVVALARRAWKHAIGFSFASFFLVFSCSSWLSESPSGTYYGDDSLTVVTWNLGLNTCDAAKVAAEIRALHPDVVLFQEARADKLELITEALGELYPFHEHFYDDLFSKAYLSNIEPVSVEFLKPENSKNFLELIVPFGETPLTITSIHTNKAFAFFGRKWFGYDQMMKRINLAASTPTSLVVGDFNLTERNTVYRDIQDTGLVDSYRERHSDPGFTFPAFGRYRHLPLPPLLRIDYVWHTKNLKCVTIERTASGDSDHRGLVARIARRDR